MVAPHRSHEPRDAHALARVSLPADRAKSEDTVGIVGAGKLGRTLARLSAGAGYTVQVAGSGPRARTARVLEVFGVPAATAELSEVARADIVVLAIPLPDFRDLDPQLFSGSVIVDPMNYWEETDGPLTAFDLTVPTSVEVQRHFADAHVVKAFNHVAYKDLAEGGRSADASHRWGIAVAANDDEARVLVSDWVSAIGFDPVPAGRLDDTVILQTGNALFGATLSAAELRSRLIAGR